MFVKKSQKIYKHPERAAERSKEQDPIELERRVRKGEVESKGESEAREKNSQLTRASKIGTPFSLSKLIGRKLSGPD